MKRSEALKKLEEALERTTGGDPETGEKLFPSIDYMAYAALKCVEELGMLPPIEPGRTEYDLDLGIPEWEPED